MLLLENLAGAMAPNCGSCNSVSQRSGEIPKIREKGIRVVCPVGDLARPRFGKFVAVQIAFAKRVGNRPNLAGSLKSKLAHPHQVKLLYTRLLLPSRRAQMAGLAYSQNLLWFPSATFYANAFAASADPYPIVDFLPFLAS
ncbi:hypothetical protein [Sinorhizobium alkalisoli]|uniref:hypothetical protein n=1 Tax=Sinorhizobium alkalisoli TaxID=1752398 RepID=UPI001041D57E|nr:hypothetical protein [Sinorhizobium alkalisoli]